MDWRKLSKKELMHLIEMMHSDDGILETVRTTRQGQNAMALNGKEICYTCKTIAHKIGIE